MNTKLINGKYFTRLKTNGQVFEFWTNTRDEAFKIASELTGMKY
ncbi:MAG: hypothetical protein ACRC0S_08025 [Fusobacteriaceae bacterium]